MTAVRSLAYVVLFYLWTALVAVGFTPILFGPTRWTFGMFHLWGRGVVGLLPICGIRVEVRGREFIPTGAAIVAPKHQCMLDVFAQFTWLPACVFVMKKELAWIPWFGWYARKAGVILSAQAPAPFKLGTFQLQNRTFIGIVVRDTQVIDFAAADSVIGRGRVAAPADMKQLIERYDAGVRDRIYAVLKAVTSSQGGTRPAYVHELSSLKTLPPIMYPMTMLNAAVNYREHGEEMDRRAGQPQAAGAPPPGGRSASGGQRHVSRDARRDPPGPARPRPGRPGDARCRGAARRRSRAPARPRAGPIARPAARVPTARRAPPSSPRHPERRTARGSGRRSRSSHVSGRRRGGKP